LPAAAASEDVKDKSPYTPVEFAPRIRSNAFGELPSKGSILMKHAPVLVDLQHPELFDVVCLSEAHLGEMDMDDIVKIVEKVDSAKARTNDAKPFIVDLQGNRLMPTQRVTENLIRIINLKHVSFVNISVNPIASLDGMEFFSRLNPDKELPKLIFVPEHWLAAQTFMALFDCKDEKRKSEIMTAVLGAHRSYYKVRV
jgi:hypothetical protein